MGSQRVAIVGGGGAGDAAAFGLRKHGFDGEVVIISADANRPYDRPYLSKEYLRSEVDLPKVFLHDENSYAENKIELKLGQRVVGGSLSGRRLALDGGIEVAFDTLILATGGRPRWLPGAPRADNVFTLRSLDDANALRGALQQSRRVLLIGAGFIGAEVGASARTMGKDVLMVEAAPVPLGRALGDEVGKVYAAIHRSKGVDVRTGTTVAEWHETAGRVVGATLSDGRRDDFDLVLLGVGIDTNLELAAALGLPIESGGVLVDEGLRAAEGVYCAGDIAVHRHPVLGRAIRVEHWEVAKGQGRTAARSIAGEYTPHLTLPYFWSDQYDVSLEYRGNATGLDQLVWRGDREALKFSVFYVRDGLVQAVLSLNDPKTNELGGRLIESRHRVEAAALADRSSDLAELISVPPARSQR
jgi:3-phenylpropionate/trans-cinnamate dioxygenase ferredoxin reductase subunit